MSRQQQRASEGSRDSKRDEIDVEAEHDPATSRRASNASLQREAAARGVAGPSQALPYADRIQAAFGQHDVSGIQAHFDPKSTGAIGAEAYATGDHVVFSQQPDLHTAAHEAAHVVQQARGVNLYGGVGEAGDAHERNADAVADRVVAGQSAADLLGAPSRGHASPGEAVQLKDEKSEKSEHNQTDLHDKADSASLGAGRAALVHFTKQLYEWMPELDRWMRGSTEGDAGDGPATNAINGIYTDALSQSARVGVVLGTVDKNDVKKLQPEVEQVAAAYNQFWGAMQQGVNWLQRHGSPWLDLTKIQTNIDGYATRLGLDKLPFPAKRQAPSEKLDDLTASETTHELEALEAAIASVKGGNAADASRIVLHTRQLKTVLPNPKKYHGKLQHFFDDVAALEKAQPDLKDRLAEPHNALLELLKQK